MSSTAVAAKGDPGTHPTPTPVRAYVNGQVVAMGVVSECGEQIRDAGPVNWFVRRKEVNGKKVPDLEGDRYIIDFLFPNDENGRPRKFTVPPFVTATVLATEDTKENKGTMDKTGPDGKLSKYSLGNHVNITKVTTEGFHVTGFMPNGEKQLTGFMFTVVAANSSPEGMKACICVS